MKNRLVSATDFKAKCLALLDEIEEHGGTITITRRGHPVAALAPVIRNPWKSPKGAWAAKVRIVGDIEKSDTADLWEVVRQP